MNIPEEIVEQVARVVNKEGWTCSDDHWQPDWYDECNRCQRAARNLARAALTAAAPLLMAQAWEVGYEHGRVDGLSPMSTNNPYKEQK